MVYPININPHNYDHRSYSTNYKEKIINMITIMIIHIIFFWNFRYHENNIFMMYQCDLTRVKKYSNFRIIIRKYRFIIFNEY